MFISVVRDEGSHRLARWSYTINTPAILPGECADVPTTLDPPRHITDDADK
jgi:hypothetical protein